MVALIHNHSLGLKLWRVLGVVLMLTQSGCDVKDNRIKKRRLRARRECVAHQFIAEADGFLLAMDAVYYLERLVEIAEQSYEVVRRRTILDRSEAATIKRRVRARLRVARMMTKLSLPDRAAPAVVTPSTPIAAAPSAAKGAFERVDDSE